MAAKGSCSVTDRYSKKSSASRAARLVKMGLLLLTSPIPQPHGRQSGDTWRGPSTLDGMVSCHCSDKPMQGMSFCEGTEPSKSWESQGGADTGKPHLEGVLFSLAGVVRKAWAWRPTEMLSRPRCAIWGKHWQRPTHQQPSDTFSVAGARPTSTCHSHPVLYMQQTIYGSRTLVFLTKCCFHRHATERGPGGLHLELEALPSPSPRTRFVVFHFGQWPKILFNKEFPSFKNKIK